MTTTTTDGALRLSKGALLFVPDAPEGAPQLLLRVEAEGWTMPPGAKAARVRLVLEQRAARVEAAAPSAQRRVTPAHGVPEQIVGDVIEGDGDSLVVDAGPVRVVVRGAPAAYPRVSAALVPPLVARDVLVL